MQNGDFFRSALDVLLPRYTVLYWVTLGKSHVLSEAMLFCLSVGCPILAEAVLSEPRLFCLSLCWPVWDDTAFSEQRLSCLSRGCTLWQNPDQEFWGSSGFDCWWMKNSLSTVQTSTFSKSWFGLLIHLKGFYSSSSESRTVSGTVWTLFKSEQQQICNTYNTVRKVIQISSI